MKILFFFILLSILSCSSEKEKTTTPETANQNVEKKNNKKTKKINEEKRKLSEMTIEGDLGTIDKKAVQAKFNESSKVIKNCIYKGIGQNSFVGGNLNFIFRIDLNGKVKKLSLSSTVGNRKIEKCIYNFAKSIQFVKPKGGEAKVSFPYGFMASMEIKKRWGMEKVKPAFRKIKTSLLKCSDGTSQAPSNYQIVFYLLPDAELGPLGISTGEELVSDKFYKCVKTNLKKAKFPDPLGTVAKVTLDVSP
ncbi:MAG: AgmX/PglI C-terminal domain-containing protein [Myxococcota bacterium]